MLEYYWLEKELPMRSQASWFNAELVNYSTMFALDIAMALSHSLPFSCITSRSLSNTGDLVCYRALVPCISCLAKARLNLAKCIFARKCCRYFFHKSIRIDFGHQIFYPLQFLLLVFGALILRIFGRFTLESVWDVLFRELVPWIRLYSIRFWPLPFSFIDLFRFTCAFSRIIFEFPVAFSSTLTRIPSHGHVSYYLCPVLARSQTELGQIKYENTTIGSSCHVKDWWRSTWALLLPEKTTGNNQLSNKSSINKIMFDWFTLEMSKLGFIDGNFAVSDLKIS